MDTKVGLENLKFVINDFDHELFTEDDSNEDRYTWIERIWWLKKIKPNLSIFNYLFLFKKGSSWILF